MDRHARRGFVGCRPRASHHVGRWIAISAAEFDYLPKFKLIPFTGSHPTVMLNRIEKLNWNFQYDDSKVEIPFRYKVLNFAERLTGKRLFDFRNYRVLK